MQSPRNLFRCFSFVSLVTAMALSVACGSRSQLEAESESGAEVEALKSRAQSGSCAYDASIGARMASIARARTHGNTRATGRCWAFVDDDIEALMAAYGNGSPARYGAPWPTMAAYTWANWAVAHPLTTARNFNLRPAPEYVGRSANSVPLGSVIIFRPGKCGFNSRYGHAEVKIAENQFASDFIAFGRSCAPDYVFVPASGC